MTFASQKRGAMPEWYVKKSKQKRELLITKCKQVWEKARVGHLSDKDRKPLVEELMNGITGHIEEVVFKHDASRMVQCCIKYGTPQDISHIYEELKPRMLELIKSTYGKYIVLAFMNHLKSLRPDIMDLCKGRVEELLKNKDSAYMIEVIYHTYASPKQKKAMLSELYCVQVKKSPQYSGMTLAKVIETAPSLKVVIKDHMKKLLFALVQKGGLGDMTIILKALWEYLSLFQDDDFVELLQEQIIEFLHHKDGMCIANFLIRRSTAKHRKTILKTFKPHLIKVWKEEYGHLVLITAFDCVDDTKMLQKNLITDVAINIDGLDLLTCQYARRVVSFLLTKSTKLVPNNYATMLRDDKALSLDTSKKESAVRFNELKDSCEAEFTKYITTNMHLFLASDACTLVESLIVFGNSDLSTAILRKVFQCAQHDLELLKNNKFGKMVTRILKSEKNEALSDLFVPFLSENLTALVNTDAKYMLSSFAKGNQCFMDKMKSLDNENEAVEYINKEE
eukprot:NODE_178_length_15814_cov_0.338657.p3 type:complete len:508 gc:universal NODE_178_length_15814_cov_0.338657:6063-7586(+)